MTRITIAEIKAVVCGYFDVTESAIDSPSRYQRHCLPRHTAMWLAKELTGHSARTIGKHFGGRDRTTVRDALKNVNNDCDNFDEARTLLCWIRAGGDQ